MDNPTEKYALIYEFNNESPLFARVANQYIDAEKYQEAITILEKGIFNYPEYPTAYFLYAIALANLGDRSEAIEMVRKATELHGTTESLKYYMDLIGNIVQEDEVETRIVIDEDENEIVIDEDENEIVIDEDENEIVIDDDENEMVIDEKKNEMVIDDDENEIVIDEDENEMVTDEGKNEIVIEEDQNEMVTDDENEIVIRLEENKSEMNDELEILANKLHDAIMPKVDDDEDLPDDITESDIQFQGKSLVSETLAKIYFNQGNYKQAQSIYETLIDIQPEKKDYYEDMIAQIKDKI